MNKMEIELLYFEDCPSWKTMLENVKSILAEEGLNQAVDLLKVESNEEAELRKFTGSPTLRINGNDLFPPGHKQYALGCRLYQTPDGLRNLPTVEMLRDRVKHEIHPSSDGS